MTRLRRITAPLFSKSGLAALRSFIDHETLFAFDLDGTLTPITADPRGILVSEATREELDCLINRATVAIITGRSRSDAQVHIGITPQFLIGNHGAEGLPGWEEREREFTDMCLDWEHKMGKTFLQENVSGISIENKGTSLSIHYRAAPYRRRARALILRCIDLLTPRPRRVGGKCVENLIPEGAPDKGTAMLYLMDFIKYQKGFYIGDDVTDEDVFRLDRNCLFTVRVGTIQGSLAQYRLRNQEETVRLLREINQILKPGRRL
ncbi:MAG: trehalose-phosphatase [Syntrophus sp. (in: bacteria)]|nr:trehalose-phosphatase [Syntrophus sp. (in: bacteria)]